MAIKCYIVYSLFTDLGKTGARLRGRGYVKNIKQSASFRLKQRVLWELGHCVSQLSSVRAIHWLLSSCLIADIEQMFHSFLVQEQHRDLLRFFWYKDNNPNRELTEYRMKVHVLGNTSSPAVATFCLRKTAKVGEQEFGSDAKDFVYNNFYVDDGLKSVAIDLLTHTRDMLATAIYVYIRYHPVI